MIVYGVVPLYLYVYDGTQLCRYRRRVAEIFNNPDTSYTHYNRAFKDKQQLLIAEIIAAKMLFMTVWFIDFFRCNNTFLSNAFHNESNCNVRI